MDGQPTASGIVDVCQGSLFGVFHMIPLIRFKLEGVGLIQYVESVPDVGEKELTDWLFSDESEHENKN